MRNLASKLTPEEYERNFADIAPPLDAQSAAIESARCLFCHDAPCVQACPTHIDVPLFIRKIGTGNLRGSAHTILSANILGYSCARVCPVEVLCEGACVLNAEGERPVAIGRLQRRAVEHAFNHDLAVFSAGPANGLKIAVVGAGPAGLGCAAELAQLGYEVVVYDRRRLAGGLNTFGVAEYKMTAADALREVKLVERLGVRFVTGLEIGKDISLESLLSGFDAVFLGIGLGATEPLKIPGEDLAGVVDALTFIEAVKRRRFDEIPVGRRVAVVGGGNTAIDAATQARRLGAKQVTIVYRRSLVEMKAYHFEIELAKADGVAFEFLAAPISIVGASEAVTALECERVTLGPPDVSGRRRPEPIPGSDFMIPADMVIKALGQTKLAALLSRVPGLKLRNGRPAVDPDTGATSHPKVFAGGDCANGGREVVHAVAEGKRAARGIHARLMKQAASIST